MVIQGGPSITDDSTSVVSRCIRGGGHDMMVNLGGAAGARHGYGHGPVRASRATSTEDVQRQGDGGRCAIVDRIGCVWYATVHEKENVGFAGEDG